MIRFLILSLSFISVSFGQFRDIPEVVTKVATSTANWLKLETSARAIAMGGAHVASGRGISGIPYNPASIAFIESSEAHFSMVNYIAGIQHGVLSYGRKMGPSDYVGLHLFYLDSGPMAVTNEYYPDGTGEDFRVVSTAFRTTYARKMTDRLKVGGSLNYIRDVIYDADMQAIAFDVGSNFDTGIYGVMLGMSITNFGPEVQYNGESLHITVPDTIDVDERVSKITTKFPLPLVFRLGIENEIVGPNSVFIKHPQHSLKISIDGIKPNDFTVYGTMGLEYSWQNLAFARMGTRLGHDTAGLSAGAGLKVRLGKMMAVVDYAVVDYDLLKSTHQVSLGIEF